MADDTIEEQEPAVWAKFPWQKAVIILLSGIVGLFGWQERQRAAERDREHELYTISLNINKELRLENKDQQLKLDACNEGKAEFIMGLLNNELALKLSRDTSATSKLIISGLIKANQQLKSNQE